MMKPQRINITDEENVVLKDEKDIMLLKFSPAEETAVYIFGLLCIIYYYLAVVDSSLITVSIANSMIYPLIYYLFYDTYHSIFALLVFQEAFSLWGPYLIVLLFNNRNILVI